eukprot:scaffold859_cov190-Alexandrium_tamarense.AAC.8
MPGVWQVGLAAEVGGEVPPFSADGYPFYRRGKGAVVEATNVKWSPNPSGNISYPAGKLNVICFSHMRYSRQAAHVR